MQLPILSTKEGVVTGEEAAKYIAKQKKETEAFIGANDEQKKEVRRNLKFIPFFFLWLRKQHLLFF